MDIHLLRSFEGDQSLKELRQLMTPSSEINDLIKCNHRGLLELRLSEVQNLFKVDEETFSFKHESNLVISKFQCKKREYPNFKANFEERTFFKNGINYLGTLKVNGIDVCVLGNGSYDPASNDPYLTKRDYCIITGIFCASLYALKYSGETAFRKVYQVFEPNKTYKSHKKLVDFMKYQIEEGVIRKGRIVDYGEYLKQHFNHDEALLKDCEDLLMYLNLLEMYPEENILPSEKYLLGLEKDDPERASRSGLLNFIKSHKNKIFLLPDPHFAKKAANLYNDENLYDLRSLSQQLDELEEEYSNRLNKALSTRHGPLTDANPENKMQALVKPYAQCILF